MNSNSLIQASVAIPASQLEYVVQLIENVGGYIRVSRSEDDSSGLQNLIDSGARKIREVRQKSGLTQKDLAVALGVPQSRISDYEGGVRNMPQNISTKLDRLIAESRGISFIGNSDSCQNERIPLMSSRKFMTPRHLFRSYSKVTNHLRKGGNFEVNGMLSAQVGKSAFEINRMLVEEQISFDKMCQHLNDKRMADHPYPKVEAHLRNMLYYSRHELVEQWGLMSVLDVSEYKEIPPCLLITIDGRELAVMDDDSTSVMNLVRRAEKVRSPLLERLSEIAHTK